MPPIDFNPRSREGSDCKSPDVDGHYCEFQSTLPRRERLHVLPVPLFNAEFQSTLPRRERHQAGRTSDEAFRISIHAPAKGATISASIHCWSTAQFQSTLPRRERRLHAGFHGRRQVISIHAPAKGATYHKRSCCRTGAFQSTLPRRERRCAGGARAVGVYFNPRSREGSDTAALPRAPATSYFNPRSREGSDVSRYTFEPWAGISIHAPVKGAT